MTPRASIAATAAMQLLLGGIARGQDDAALASLVNDWEAARYESVARTLIPVRQAVDPRHRLAVDVMIASSLCRTPHASWRRQGLDWLAYVAQSYAVARTDTALQSALRSEERACRLPPVALTQARARKLRVVAYGQGASLSVTGGKMWGLACGYQPPWGGGASSAPEGATLASAARREAAVVDLPRLKIPVDARRDAAAVVAGLDKVSSARTPTVVATDHFLLWSVSGHSESQGRELMTSLEAYLAHATDSIGLKPPDAGFYVLLAPQQDLLGQVVRQALGLGSADRLPVVLGASSDAVPALAAVMQAATKMPGTVAHELMHVLVHRDFPDAPLWLDEGLASLMETANLDGARVVPIPNWRGRVLERARRAGRRPSLRSLLAPGALERAVTQVEHSDENTIRARDELFALDRYFALFLSERGVLPQVYRALRSRSAMSITGDRIEIATRTPDEVLAVVGRALADRPGSVEEQFEEWLTDALRRTPAQLRC